MRAWPIAVFASLALALRLQAILLPLEYHERMWTVENGLPHNSVTQTLQDSTGFLWFATLGGLARFDGREFREMHPPAEHRPGGFNIRSFAEERPGALVVVCTGPSVLRLTGETWSVHPVTAALAELRDTPDEVFVDRVGNVWLETIGRRLLRCGLDGKTDVIVGAGRVTRGRRFSLACDGKGQVWVAEGGTLGVFRDGALQRLQAVPEEPRTLVQGRRGRIWVCGMTQLHSLEDGVLTVKSGQAPWAQGGGYVRVLFEDSRERVWIFSSRRTLYRYDEGRVAEIAAPNPHLRHIAEDREGNLWMATEGQGVAQLGGKAYRLHNLASGLAHELVSGVAEAPDGVVWLANRPGGLVAILPDGTVAQHLGRSSPPFYANVVHVDEQERVWFGGSKNGLHRWTPRTDEVREMLPPPPNVHLLFRARNNDLWFVADPNMIGYFRGDTLHVLTGQPGFVTEDVRAMAQDGAGNIWLGGRTGDLLRWDGVRQERFGRSHGLPGSPIHAIAVDSASRLWVATIAGLVVKDGADIRLLTQAHGLADDMLEQVLEDDDENLWFASRRGLFFVAKAELLRVAREGGRVTSHLMGRNQGLAAVPSIMNYGPASAKSRDGKLWFATAQGAVVVDPRKLPRDLPAPPVLITGIHVDGRAVPAVENLRVGPGVQRLEFRLAALTFTAPENVVVRHRLDGVDRDWLDTGVERTARYMNLAPGEYRLRVSARNSAGQWNAEGATLAFTVAPAWWERPSFRFAVVVLLTALTAWLARVFAQRRLQRKLRRLEQVHALEKERARIARDLHDDLGASLTAVSLEVERLVAAVPGDLGPQVSGLAWRTRRLATDLSGIVWTMSDHDSSLDRLSEFLRRYAERLFRNTGVTCMVSGVESIPAVPLAPDPQHQLLAATKEALNNILKHAQANEARMELRYAQGVFEVRIADNGKGVAFDPGTKPRGNGLRNMRFRLEEIGGTCVVTAAPGRGTLVLLSFPCAPE